MPVEITELPEERLPGPVEAAAYYVVAEAITNVAKYAQASHATVSVRRANGRATVTVADDGVGGADPTRAPGCAAWPTASRRSTGASTWRARRAGGTRISAEIPCGLASRERATPSDCGGQELRRALLVEAVDLGDGEAGVASAGRRSAG